MGDRSVIASAPVFRRYLSSAFTTALSDLVEAPHGQWWRDVLLHPDLKLAIRADAIDVYHRGASIFRIAQSNDGSVTARTHFKYLMRRRQGYAVLAADGKTFVYDPAETSWASYEPNKTLDEMVAASKRFAGSEKSELHPLVMYSSVIDVEIAFRSSLESGTNAARTGEAVDESDAASDDATSQSKKGSVRQDRLDAATLEDRGGALWIVFHEAKHFKNPELREAPHTRRPLVIRSPAIGVQSRPTCRTSRTATGRYATR